MVSRARAGTADGGSPRRLTAVLVAVLAAATVLVTGVAVAGPAAAQPWATDPAGAAAVAFPADPAAPAAPAEGDGCSWYDLFCAAGSAAGELVNDLWITAMLALWGAGLWVLGLAFGVIDALTTPDLSADGPLAQVYPTTFALGAAVAVLMALIQVGVAAFRRDGESIGRIAVGVCQFGLVWAGYVGIAALLVTGVAGLTTGLLQGLLGIDTMAAFESTVSAPEQVTDATVATVLGVSAIFLLFPASAAYLLVMLVREAALMLLAATSAISAGGLLAETSRAWFWKSLRWFIAALLISPLAVLILGLGVSITEGVVTGSADTTEAEIGMAVIGCLLILIGAIAPLTLFRLLAFVDPGTSSGASMRQSMAASGGLLGLLGRGAEAGSAAGGSTVRGAAGGGSGAAAKVDGAGRSQGESTAAAATQSRFGGSMRALAAGSAKAGQVAGGAAATGSDVLSVGGVGHQAPFYGQPGPPGGATPGGGTGRAGEGAAPDRPPQPEPPPPPTPPTAPTPPSSPGPGPAPQAPRLPVTAPSGGSAGPGDPTRPATVATRRPTYRPPDTDPPGWSGDPTRPGQLVPAQPTGTGGAR